jgi:DNA-binding NarL/FixJ family response regulator
VVSELVALREAVKLVGGEHASVQHVPSVEEAARLLRPYPEPSGYDLVISHFGEPPIGSAAAPAKIPAAAENLLSTIRKQDIRVPVIVYSQRKDLSERKASVLQLGAHGYYFTLRGLLKGIESVLNTRVEHV